MTYGLVYKPINGRLGASSSQSDVEYDVIRPNKKIPNSLAMASANESKETDIRATIANIVVDTHVNQTDNDINDNQNRSIIYPYTLFFVEDAHAWPLQKDITFQQYKVYENDSEIEGSSHKVKVHSGHGLKKQRNKKKASKKGKVKGTTHHQFKGKHKGKKGGHEAEEHEDGKYAGQKSGYTSYGKKQRKYNKSAHKKKQREHKVEKKAKKYGKKKGYKDKWNLDKEDKVHEFWKKHREEGEFHVFGLKKKHKNENEKDGKKHKWKKKQKKKHRKSSSSNN